MTRTETCEERLPAALAERIEDMRNLAGWIDAWNQTHQHQRSEAAEERAREYPLYLGIERTYTLRLELSTGGPADYITATVEDGRLANARYHFADWYDHADTQLTGNDLATVTRYVASLVDLDSPEEYARTD